MDASKGLDAEVRRKFDERRLALKYEDIIAKSFSSLKQSYYHKKKKKEVKQERTIEAKKLDIQKNKGNLGVQAYFFFVREQKAKFPLI